MIIITSTISTDTPPFLLLGTPTVILIRTLIPIPTVTRRGAIGAIPMEIATATATVTAITTATEQSGNGDGM